MKISSFYYIDYPDSLPTDPLFASSEVYVEVSGTDGDINNFDLTYAFTVCTIEFVRRSLSIEHFFSARSVVVVDRFDDHTIKNALEAILPKINTLGLLK